MQTLVVPVSLLLDRGLTPSAKVIWMLVRLDPDHSRPAQLQAASGLSRPTVLKALAQLAAISPHLAAGSVTVPADLLRDRRLGAQARVLYGVLQSLPGQRQCTYAELSSLTGISLPTVRRAVGELTGAGWVEASQVGPRTPIRFTFAEPHTAAARQALDRIKQARWRGEALMKEFLSLLIDADHYEENATPRFLVNPFTGERMELDRFYPQHGVAFEFNGPQHYRPGGEHTAAQVAKQRGRDYIKAGMCGDLGIKLVVIHREDLSLAGMRAKIGDGLPLRDLRGQAPLLRLLETVARRYRTSARAV